jgi:predicted TPR repeat methyltransferase
MRNNLLRELAELDRTMVRLEDRRADLINMLDVLATLGTFERVLSTSLPDHPRQE